jgi:cyanophycin synthetase
MAGACRGRVLFFARSETEPVLAGHKASGGRAVFVRGGEIVLGEGPEEHCLLPLAEVKPTHGGRVPFQIENALAAAAAGWCLGLPWGVLRAGLSSFRGQGDEVPGRFNVLGAGDAVVIVDYAHNPSAVAALVEGLEAFPASRRTLVFSGCNRRDADLIEMGEQAGGAFDRVILYADWGHSGRSDGELNAVLRQGLARGGGVREVQEVASERAALDLGLGSLEAGELLVLGVESIEESLAHARNYLTSRGVTPSE